MIFNDCFPGKKPTRYTLKRVSDPIGLNSSEEFEIKKGRPGGKVTIRSLVTGIDMFGTMEVDKIAGIETFKFHGQGIYPCCYVTYVE